uniref:Uncharacterized protein n=1 Tax=Salix viminalis TaxID=40686 RepID=A0A6N2LPV6_SALVM
MALFLEALAACGGDDGAVECFDREQKLQLEVTALKFDEDGGFTMAVGSSGGKNLTGGGCKHLTHLSARFQAEFSSSFFLGAWWGGRVCGLVCLKDIAQNC